MLVPFTPSSVHYSQGSVFLLPVSQVSCTPVKTKQKSWNPGKTNLFCFQHFPEIIWNNPILLWDSWSIKLQDRKKGSWDTKQASIVMTNHFRIKHLLLVAGHNAWVQIWGSYFASSEAKIEWVSPLLFHEVDLPFLCIYIQVQTNLPSLTSPISPTTLITNPLTHILGLHLLVLVVLANPSTTRTRRWKIHLMKE